MKKRQREQQSPMEEEDVIVVSESSRESTVLTGSDDDEEVQIIRQSSSSQSLSHQLKRQKTETAKKAASPSSSPPSPLLQQPSTRSMDSPKHWALRIAVDENAPHKGWFVHCRLPKSLTLGGQAAASESSAALKGNKPLDLLMQLKPDDPGKVMMWGKVVDTPRLQKAYLRDYFFTGMKHEADPELPPVLKEVMDWANMHLCALGRSIPPRRPIP